MPWSSAERRPADEIEARAAADAWIVPAERRRDGVNVVGYLQRQLGIGEIGLRLVDVLAAGPPFNVNLSQIFTITPGITYELTFRARTRNVAARTMLAGLGLNEAPFTADTVVVLLLDDDWRSYSYTFTPAFGNSNSRVLFDMGAAVGDVFIDDVSVTEVVP